MYTIKAPVINKLIIDSSKFITIISNIRDEDDCKKILKNTKEEYKNASHYCYAYIADETKRFNDDGEPTGTAGKTILSILEKKNLNYIICIIIRYFGGIKLGIGGLTRAYSGSVSKALNISEIIKTFTLYKIEIKFQYSDIKDVDYILNKIDVISKNFNDEITYVFNITEDKLNIIDRLKDKRIDVIEIEKTFNK